MSRTRPEASDAVAFLATVTQIDGSAIFVRKLGYNASEGPYRIADGLALTVGDEVVVQDDGALAGNPVVTQKVRSAS